MLFELFINFDGNCREALEFYANVFKKEAQNLMTYDQAPANPDYPLQETDRNKIMYASIRFDNMLAMFMDVSEGMPFTKGTNISPTLSMDSKEEVARIFQGLAEGGTVETDLRKTFFSECYGSVTDKFGINWQLLQMTPKAT
ncbi:VOC family protein [Breznakiella homolactica]|uniref:VOC family protein n=1 Tax=Breznakiella homolactica TaxID=2798577 RepID=A0A7T8B984_9SPIR|nr:VOC family protein [Breznakiella homolactica]QQO07685.1 VOC family protein [Breznakiella homolactica]